MIQEWLAREGWMIVNWWLVATLAGVGVLPLCFCLLGNLPDKGYTFARAVGLMLTGFMFWLLATLGFIRNTPGSIMLVWLILLVVGLVALYSGGSRFEWRKWWRENRSGVIAAELLFIIVFLSWAVYRAHINEVASTEKPMDLAFMSAIMRTETFPPPDPWASGYSISYYYFGYVIGAMIVTMAGTISSIGYNLWTAMLFALAALGGYGVVYNLVKARTRVQPSAVGFAVLGAVVLTVMGNLQFALVDLPYNTRTASAESLAFWDVRDRETPRAEGVNTSPEGWEFWWWFKAARVIKDRTLPGQGGEGHTEAINEFPMFSYVLADNHPHVMGLPFVLLAMGVGLNIVLSPRKPDAREILFYGVVIGGLVFMNTWDSPIYLMILVGAELLRRIREKHYLKNDDWAELGVFGGALLLITLAAYLPFIINFRSQLGGVLPNITQPTRLQQYFLVFGATLILAVMFVGGEAWRGIRQRSLQLVFGLQLALFALLGLLLAFALLIIGGALIESLRPDVVNTINNLGGWNALMPTILGRRVEALPTLLLMLGMIALIVARIFPHPSFANTQQDEQAKADETAPKVSYPAATGYALLLIGAGVVLTLIPEFVYLRDNFGYRMNTIFKFYYQAWALFAVAGTYGLYTLLFDAEQPRLGVPAKAAVATLATLSIYGGLLYPMYAPLARAYWENGRYRQDPPPALTLDGARSFLNDSDHEVLRCLEQVAGRQPAVVAAAIRGSFDSYRPDSGRVGTLLGMPSVWGWGGHQSQWRGSSLNQVMGTRPDDLRRLYTDLRLDVVQPIIDQYQIDYIVYGTVERQADIYGSAGEQKFLDHFTVVCESTSGTARVFRTNRQ